MPQSEDSFKFKNKCSQPKIKETRESVRVCVCVCLSVWVNFNNPLRAKFTGFEAISFTNKTAPNFSRTHNYKIRPTFTLYTLCHSPEISANLLAKKCCFKNNDEINP